MTAARLVLVVTVLLCAVAVALGAHFRRPVQASRSVPARLCDASRLNLKAQAAWVFWMGPYRYAPCKWMPLNQDV